MSDDTTELETGSPTPESSQPRPSKARRLTLIVLGVCVGVFVWYLLADRHTPYTDQARVNSLTIPIVSQVPGYVLEIRVRLHSIVQAGDRLMNRGRGPATGVALRVAEVDPGPHRAVV
jgi:multidrug resistance efflux pump